MLRRESARKRLQTWIVSICVAIKTWSSSLSMKKNKRLWGVPRYREAAVMTRREWENGYRTQEDNCLFCCAGFRTGLKGHCFVPALLYYTPEEGSLSRTQKILNTKPCSCGSCMPSPSVYDNVSQSYFVLHEWRDRRQANGHWRVCVACIFLLRSSANKCWTPFWAMSNNVECADAEHGMNNITDTDEPVWCSKIRGTMA